MLSTKTAFDLTATFACRADEDVGPKFNIQMIHPRDRLAQPLQFQKVTPAVQASDTGAGTAGAEGEPALLNQHMPVLEEASKTGNQIETLINPRDRVIL